MTDDIVGIIATAIRDMRAEYPGTGEGTTRDQIFEGNENSIPLAKAAILALDKAGYKIVAKAEPEKGS
ncbi:hypothetical protein NKJ90_26985 [Mesorhizobium sp. M0051]|uniref:hypothetical protein n=1 Tax=Mesorhizobium sp. M0051 TaxID=2956862 RepID=UPI003339A36A